MKRINFPLGIVEKIETNDLGETIAVEVRKGKSGEILKRHVTSLIPILTDIPSVKKDAKQNQSLKLLRPPKRKAAIISRNLTKRIISGEAD